MPQDDLGLVRNDIVSVERTSGTGQPGSVDTYTITMRSGATFTFTITNGTNGGTGGVEVHEFTSVMDFLDWTITADLDKIISVSFFDGDMNSMMCYLDGGGSTSKLYNIMANGTLHELTSLSSGEKLVAFYKLDESTQIDTALNENSVNPVQNKAIVAGLKKYIGSSGVFVYNNPSAPYNDYDTFPLNKIISVLNNVGVSHAPTDFQGNIITFDNTTGESSVIVQLGISTNGNVVSRTKFGNDSWSQWNYLNEAKYVKKGNQNLYNNPSAPYDDCDTFPVNEIVSILNVSGMAHAPAHFQGTMFTIAGSGSVISQIGVDVNGAIHTRNKFGEGAWSSWLSPVYENSEKFVEALKELETQNFSLVDLRRGHPWVSAAATATNVSKFGIALANGYYVVDQSFVAGDEIDIYVKCDKKLAFYIASDYAYSFEIDPTNGKFERHTIKFASEKTPLLMIGNTTETVHIEMYVVNSGIPLNPRLDLGEDKIDANAQKLIQISNPTLARDGGVWLCTGDYPSWYSAGSGWKGLRVDVSQYKKIAIYGANTPGTFAAFTTSNNRKISNLNNSDKVYDVPANAKWLLISGSDGTIPRVFNFDYVTLGVSVENEDNEYEHIYGVGNFDFIVRGTSSKDISQYCSMAMFPKMAVIGDSYSSGLVYDENGGIGADYQLSWLTMMARRNGATGTCYSYGGASTHSWLENQDHGLPAMLADTPKNLYFIMLGINDSSTVTLGTIADATDDYNNNPDTYYGNYARIIRNIQVHAPNSKIILICPPMTGGGYTQAIKDLAAKYGLPYITTSDEYFSSQYYILKYGHPVASSYAGMSMIYEKEACKAILNNPTYFNDYVCDGPLS